ncbi:MAG: rhodanese-like domain-containing protein [Actinomycetota bacterium]
MTIPEISVDDLAALGPDVRLIDVREEHEWVEARAPHAVLVPLGTVPDQLDQFDGSPTYVICRSGARSLRACEFAAAQGHDVVNVAGGTLAWAESGHPVESGGAGGAGG